jgi:hypothetical protein
MKRVPIAILAFVIFSQIVLAKTLRSSVEIVNRQASTSRYGYTVPGYANSNCNVYSAGNAASANCSASGMPSRSVTFQVKGATLSLLLPDSRIVVVNCDAKTNWTDLHQGMYRSCRVPPVDAVEAEFDGDKARLTWSVSLDGSKNETETYKIIAVLSKAPGSAEDEKK